MKKLEKTNYEKQYNRPLDRRGGSSNRDHQAKRLGENMLYIYGCIQRPPTPGATPKYGLKSVEAFETKKPYQEHQNIKIWGLATYNRRLRLEEEKDYDLILLEIKSEGYNEI